MKTSNWTEQTLFSESANVGVHIRLGLDQESQNLGMWAQVVRKPSGEALSERVGWYNYTPNGVAQVCDAILEILRETEETHGLPTDNLEVIRVSAPF